MAYLVHGASSRSLIETVNGGALLRGTYQRNEPEDVNIFEDYSIPRLPLFSLTENANPKIKGSLMKRKTQEIEFESKELYDEFLEKTENSEGFLGCNTKIIEALSAGISLGVVRDSKESSTETLKRIFYCRAKYEFVPVASVQLTSDDVTVTENAYKALYRFCELRQQQGDTDGEKQRKEMYRECVKFFDNYGTHVNVGIIHLGGILMWNSVFAAETKSSKTEIQTMVKAELDAHVNAWSASAGAKFSKTASRKEGHFNKADLASTFVSRTGYGGDITSESAQNWKESLEGNSLSWVIVDTGSRNSYNQKGVWDIIRERHENTVNNELTITINSEKQVQYDKERCMQSLYMFFMQWIYRRKIKMMIRELPKDPNDQNASDYLKILKKILTENDTRKERLRDFDDNNSWYYLLKDEDMVARFLRKALEQEPMSNAVLGKISLSIQTLLTKHIGADRTKNSFGEDCVKDVIKLQEKKEEDYKKKSGEAR